MKASGLNPTIQGITNGCDTPINLGGASPAMSVESLLFGQLEPLTFGISQEIQDETTFQVVETFRSVSTQGIVQPLEVRSLAIKPEGERRWTWLKIWALADLSLKPGDRITVQGTPIMPENQPYRIMGTKPWARHGFMYYEVVADYQIPQGYAYI
jgi:hypothetical protein